LVNIPAANPGAFVRAHRAEIDAAIARVLDSGRYILGTEVETFEREFADFVGVSHAIAVANGTEALWLSLKAIGVGPGDEVITVSLTATATVAAIVETGARPVFVDICPDDLTMDPAQVAKAITPHTRAIIPVHLYGQAVRIEEICSGDVPVLEDCAQAHGARCDGKAVGAWGDLGAFSFYPTKNLGALGDAGAVVTEAAALADRLRSLREYGWQDRFISLEHGWNSRLDELQAAILRVRLRHLLADNGRRVAIAGAYTAALRGTAIVPPVSFSNRTCVFHQYVVRHPRRDWLRARLAAAGIATGIHYPLPVHQQPAYRQRCALPVTEQAASEILSLPLWPELSDNEVQHICDTLASSV
jgi:dTDP-4-amino-4,6-dideoxygalactose transaminase